jgi:hypothetical protein
VRYLVDATSFTRFVPQGNLSIVGSAADPTANKVLLKKKIAKSTTWPQKGRTKTRRLEDSNGIG